MILDMIPSKYKAYERFNGDELTDVGLKEVDQVGTIYLTRDGSLPVFSSYVLGLFNDEDMRVSYQCFDTSETPEVTLMAYQKGNTLKTVDDSEISFETVVEGRMTRDEFIDSIVSSSNHINIGLIIVSALGCILGLYWIISYYVKK